MAFQVTRARYGVSEAQSVDVTKAVRGLSSKKGLKLGRVSNEALGVGAAFPGQRKRLWVTYQTESGLTTVSALERKSLRLPV